MEDTAGITRRRLVKRSAIAGASIVWVAPVVQSFTSPAFGQAGSDAPEVCEVDGKMTGGGFILLPGGEQVNWDLRKMECPPTSSSPELKVSWTIGEKKDAVDYDFETIAFLSRTCSDNPAIANGANANWDTMDGTATGVLVINKVAQTASIVFKFVDDGEGNGSDDSIVLSITGSQAGNVLNIMGAINGGNIQAHADGTGICP